MNRRSKPVRSVLIFLAPLCALIAAFTWQARRNTRQYWLDRHLCSAVKANDVRAVRDLLGQGADPNTRELLSPLPEGFTSRVLQMLRPPKRDVDSMTPLHRAAYNGNLEIVDMLIRAGAAVEVRREGGDETPLISAAKPGNDRIVHRLLAAGADPNAKSRYTGTALRPMLALCNAVTVRYAFERGAKLDFPPAEALCAAAYNPDHGVMEILLDNGYAPKTLYGGRPIIAYAAANGNLPVVRLLVQRGADVNARDKNRRTPIQTALWLPTADPAAIAPVIDFLKSKGAK